MFARLILGIALLLAGPATLSAAVTMDTTASSNSGNTTILTWSHTLSAGNDAYLVVGVSLAKKTVSTITWGTTGLALIGTATNKKRMELWGVKLGNIASSTSRTVTVTLSGGTKLAAGAISFFGVHQTTSTGTFASATGDSNAPAVSGISVLRGEVVVDALVTEGAAGSKAPQSPTVQIEQWDASTGGGGGEASGAGSVRGHNGSASNPSSVSMSWTLASGKKWALGAVVLKRSNVTRAMVSGVAAYRSAVLGSVLEWSTVSERGTLGFHVDRLNVETGAYVRVNNALLPSLPHSRHGTRYRLVDPTARAGEIYSYRLVELEATGNTLTHGPYSVYVASSRAEVDFPDTGAGAGNFALVEDISGDSTLVEMAVGDAPVVDVYSPVAIAQPAIAKQRAADKQAARAAARTAKRVRHGPRLKVTVGKAGLYYLNAAMLADALGVPTAEVTGLIESDGLQLLHRGQRVATVAGPGNAGLYFYAQGIESVYTAENVYWLGRGEGLAMKSRNRRADKPVAGLTFRDVRHAEGNQFHLIHLFDDPDGDYWVWDFRFETFVLANNVNSFVLASPGRASDADQATLMVRLHGGSDAKHQATVGFNGEVLGTVQWDGLTPYTAEFPIDSPLLIDGGNTVTVSCGGSGVPGKPSIFYINDFDLAYARHYASVDGLLAFDSAGHRVVNVGGFETPDDIRVFDLGNPNVPVLVTPTLGGKAGNYQVTFRAPKDTAAYLAVALSAAQTPISVIADLDSDLRNSTQRIDWLIITASDMLEAAQELADYRRSQGLRILVVDIEDIYDEFSYGITDADAIWSFLHTAHTTWQVGPRYVVLAGEGSFDYKNYLQHGDAIIPTLLTPTPNGLFPSDNLYADVVGNDWLPEIAIGRLPVIDADELRAVTQKLIAYEASAGAWTQSAIVSADAPDAAGDFTADSDAIAALMPTDYTVERIHVDQLDAPTARQHMLDGIADGQAFINFFGHGGFLGLGNANLLNAADVPSLDNAGRLPVVTAFTCLAGQFGFPGQESIAEALLISPNTGAAAVWAPSGLSYNDLARQLADGFYQAAFEDGELVIGEAILKAQAHYAKQGAPQYLRDIYNLIGDPATVMK